MPSVSSAPTLDELITADPGAMGGRRVFRGTRVPIEVLFGDLADGLSIDEVLPDHETLDREDIVAVLQLTSNVLARADAA